MLIGASMLRVGFGILILYSYTINYAQRHFLWGADGFSNTDFFIEFTHFPCINMVKRIYISSLFFI